MDNFPSLATKAVGQSRNGLQFDVFHFAVYGTAHDWMLYAGSVRQFLLRQMERFKAGEHILLNYCGDGQCHANLRSFELQIVDRFVIPVYKLSHMTPDELKAWMERNDKSEVDVASATKFHPRTVRRFLEKKRVYRSTQNVFARLVYSDSSGRTQPEAAAS